MDSRNNGCMPVSSDKRLPSAEAGSCGRFWRGALYGAAAVLGWSCFSVGSTASLAQGFRPEDLTMLRYGVSAVVCSPWLMRARPANAGGLGWTRAFLLALAAGPLFGTLVNAGMLFAPLSHTAIMVPAVSMLGGMLAGRLFLDESVAAPRWAGAAIMTAGLVWLMLQGVHSPAMPYAWLGDCLFLIAGAMWASYTFMLRRWNAEPVLAVSMVNAISGVLYFPVYLFLIHDHFPHIGWGAFGRAAILQGIIAAFLTVYAYSQSVRFLGAARAAVLPAAVAPLTMTLGAITPGEFPAPQQMAALALAMAGFMGAVGLWPW